MTVVERNEDLVLIAGAGPTGLVLALWLTRLGVKVRIIDKIAEPGTTSRALAVQARTLELYHQVGIDRAVIEGGTKVQRLNLWAKGHRVARVTLQNTGQGITPYAFALTYPQDAHERLLIAELDRIGVKIERPTELVRFEQAATGVTATLRRRDGSEEICEAAYLAGCDGASSVVRGQLGVGFPGGTYTGLFYVADVEATGEAVNDDLNVDIEDADFILLFPMKGTARVRIVGTVRDFSQNDPTKLRFEDVRGKAIEHLKLDIRKVNWFSTYRVHHRVASHFQVGRAFLLGDAAHIHSPVGGQGMNTGIGDAVNLAWKLAAVVKREAPPAILDSFEPERIAFARRLVATTDRGFTFVTRRGALAQFIRLKVVPRVVPIFFRIPAARRLLFRTVSQTEVKYPNSALSEGKAGKVQGGDRLPWVPFANGIDNFAPLTSVAWQVHVYGELKPDLRDVCLQLGLAVHSFAWDSRMARAGFQRDAAYVVRPDGYVGLAEPNGDVGRIREYIGRHGIALGKSNRSGRSDPAPIL